jgi:hypothetical protein
MKKTIVRIQNQDGVYEGPIIKSKQKNGLGSASNYIAKQGCNYGRMEQHSTENGKMTKSTAKEFFSFHPRRMSTGSLPRVNLMAQPT